MVGLFMCSNLFMYDKDGGVTGILVIWRERPWDRVYGLFMFANKGKVMAGIQCGWVCDLLLIVAGPRLNFWKCY